MPRLRGAVARLVPRGPLSRIAAALLLGFWACALLRSEAGESSPVRLYARGGEVQVVSSQGGTTGVRSWMPLDGSARIAVPSGAEAVLVFPEGASIRLRAGSEAYLSIFGFGLGSRSVVFLASGTAFVDHPPYGRPPFEVRTRAGELLPRGTRYLVRVDPATGRGQVGVLEGAVRLAGGRIVSPVPPGESLPEGLLASFEP